MERLFKVRRPPHRGITDTDRYGDRLPTDINRDGGHGVVETLGDYVLPAWDDIARNDTKLISGITQGNVIATNQFANGSAKVLQHDIAPVMTIARVVLLKIVDINNIDKGVAVLA